MKPKFLGDVLRATRQRTGLSIPDMAEKLDVNKNTLGAYEREETLPDIEFLATFAQATHSDLALLMQARIAASSQSKLFGAVLDTLQARAQDGQHLVEQPRAGYAYIPLYDLAAKAGPGGRVVEQELVTDSLAFKEEWIRQELHVKPADLRLIYVEGDSMEPDLRAGDIVLLDHTDTSARREGIYVLRMDGALLVKSLQRLPGGVVKVISRNTAYEPFTLPVAELEEGNGTAIIGRVVWACRRF